MFDIFGNVFGRKKNSNGHHGSSSDVRGSAGSADETVFVSNDQGPSGQPSSTVYPTLQLTDQMLRSPPAGSCNSQPQAQPPPYPAEPQMMGSNPSRPFAASHKRTFSSPLDNVPFIPTMALVSGRGSGTGSNIEHELAQCVQVVARVECFLSSPNHSDYTFQLESSILRESMAN